MSVAGLVARARSPWYLIERNALVYRRRWMVVVSGLFEPLFYLLAMWLGLARLIDEVPGPGGEPIGYLAFVAPGLLAAAAMQGSLSEATYRLFLKIVEGRSYQGMLATPLTVTDLCVGELGWAVVRGILYTVGFLAVALPLGAVTSWWAVLCLPVALLVCVAFAALGQAATTYMRTWQDLDLTQLAMVPLLLCSTTFFPLDAYPRALQLVVEATPLFHGVALMRALTTGHVHAGLAVHVLYLAVATAVGLRWSSRRLGPRILG
jgi:lipooligosaccharide transport system permease protein